MALVINVAGYTHAFDYKGKIMIIPCDGRVHVVPDDIPNFLELKRVDAKQLPTIEKKETINPNLTKNGRDNPLDNDEEVIQVDIDEELRDVLVYDPSKCKSIPAHKFNSGYDNELNVMIAEHLARQRLDEESEAIAEGNENIIENQEDIAKTETHVRKKLTLEEKVERRKAEREASKKKKPAKKKTASKKASPKKPVENKDENAEE